MVPALEPEGEIDHVTFWFAAPGTVAESCQLAPTPMGQGFVVDEAQAEFAMLTETVCGGGVVEEEKYRHRPRSKAVQGMEGTETKLEL